MALRLTEEEYQLLLERQAAAANQEYVGGRPKSTVMRGHGYTEPEPEPKPVQKARRRPSTRRYEILDDAKDNEGLLAAGFAVEAFAKNPLMFIFVGIPAFFGALALTKGKPKAKPAARPVVYPDLPQPGQPLLYKIQRWLAGL